MIYSPREDSYLLEREVKKYAKNKSFLDIGCGTGIQGKAAIKAGVKSVLFSDINEEAVKELKSQGYNAIQSDLFSNIKEKFDLIAFNPPYLPEDKREDEESKLATTGGKKGDEIIIKFLRQAKSHLNENGIILLVVSSLTPKSRIAKLLQKQKMKKEILSEEKFFMEKLEVWKLSFR
ncbi:MAG: methyltransferase [Candidatus Pacearchaeota archaeon]